MSSKQDLTVALGYLEHLLNIPKGTFELSSYSPDKTKRFYAVENDGERIGPDNHSHEIKDLSMFIQGMCKGIETMKEVQQKPLCRICRQRIYAGRELVHIPGTTGYAHAKCKEENDARQG